LVLNDRHLVFDIFDNGADLVLHLTGHQLQLPLREIQPGKNQLIIAVIITITKIVIFISFPYYTIRLRYS
jgi:hypothetical protein